MARRPSPKQPDLQRRQFPRPLKNALVSAAILTVIFGLCGAVYTWWSGRDTAAVKIPAVPVVQTETAPLKAPKVSPNTLESVAVQTVSTPVSRGSAASVELQTNPGSTCSIALIYGYDPANKKQLPIRNDNLGEAIADDFGTVGWTWTVDSAAPVGPAHATITCVSHNRAAVGVADFVVT